MDRDDRDREVVLRHLEAVLDRDRRARARRARPRGPSRPAQNSTHARPQSARALRGSSRSRHSRCSRSSSARASSRARRTSEGVDDRRTSPPAPAARRRAAVAKSCAGAGSSGVASVAGEPAEHRPHCLARARRRSSSSSSASSSAARACSRASRPIANARPRQPAMDHRLEHRSRRRLVAALLRAAGRDARCSRARRASTSASARTAARLGSASSPMRDRSRPCPLPGGVWARAAASARRRRRSRRPGGVSRSACSASSAATADAPRRAASTRAASSAAATPTIRASPARARGGALGRSGSSTAPRSARGPLRRSSPSSRYTTEASSGCVKRIAPLVPLDHVRLERGSRARPQGRPPAAAGLGTSPRRRHECERLAGRRGKPREPRRTSSSSVSGTGSGERSVGVERAGQLEREERVAADRSWTRSSVWRAKRSVQPVVEEPVQRTDAERPTRSALPEPCRAPRSRWERCALAEPARPVRTRTPPLRDLPQREGDHGQQTRSSHWTSSTARSSGPRSAERWSASRTATSERTVASTGSTVPARSSSSAISRARRRGAWTGPSQCLRACLREGRPAPRG